MCGSQTEAMTGGRSRDACGGIVGLEANGSSEGNIVNKAAWYHGKTYHLNIQESTAVFIAAYIMSNILSSHNRICDLFSYIRTPKILAFVADQIEESMIMVPMFERLRFLADPEVVYQHYRFIPDAHGVSILCRSDGEHMEATFCFTGILTLKSTMPYNRFSDIGLGTPYGQAGHQFVMLAMPDLDSLEAVKQAISYIHAMGGLAYPEGKLKPLTDLVIDGEEVICASTPLGTPVAHALPSDIPLTLTQVQDPNSIVAQYVQQRNQIILEDNQVDIYLATHRAKAGVYELHGGACGALLRAGQVVRAEVGFRIVPAGNKVVLRMDLKSATIINDEIVATMAFAEVKADTSKPKPKHTISVSSAGPSGVVIAEQPRVKRAVRKPKNLNKESQDAEETMVQLPFSSQ
ncbi:hypothetical protein PENSPDRAFT_671232 [Peniophora sp. CONT]|nr:hypothetical protein PENSPDRAFT_671232 [Peniophora sp. CONT]